MVLAVRRPATSQLACTPAVDLRPKLVPLSSLSTWLLASFSRFSSLLMRVAATSVYGWLASFQRSVPKPPPLTLFRGLRRYKQAGIRHGLAWLRRVAHGRIGSQHEILGTTQINVAKESTQYVHKISASSCRSRLPASPFNIHLQRSSRDIHDISL